MNRSTRFPWRGLAALLVLGGLLAACGSPPSTPTLAPAPTATPTGALASPSAAPRIDQVTFCFAGGGGALDTPSHNSAIWAGIQQGAQAIGARATTFQEQDLVNFGQDLDRLIADGTDIFVVEAGSVQSQLEAAARKYPAVYFIGFDEFSPASAGLPNYAGLEVAQDQAGFLAGALAAQITHTRKVSAIIGFSALPPSWRYGEGYRAGVHYIDPAITIQVEYHDDVELARAFNDPAWGQAHAQRQLTNGSDVLFTDTSATGNGALSAVVAYQQQSGQRVFAIGADIDQYEATPEARAVLVSSALGKNGPGLEQLIRSIGAGTFRGGTHQGEVGLAPFHDLAGQVPAAAQTRLQQITRSLNDGSLQTHVPASKDAAP